jgi:hypothetical protein
MQGTPSEHPCNVLGIPYDASQSLIRVAAINKLQIILMHMEPDAKLTHEQLMPLRAAAALGVELTTNDAATQLTTEERLLLSQARRERSVTTNQRDDSPLAR